QYLERKGKKNISLSNELIWWYSISALFAVAFGALWGWQGVVFFLGQSFFAALALEIINYIEHYGLHRRVNDKGRFERVTPAHSWNSNYLLTNIALFQLQRHSDHHAYAKRRYQVLRHYEESPQLPGGYAAMYVLALFPPLWKKVMNPRVEAYYEGEMDQLFREAKRVNNIA
ncbi:MAG: fatty acid desaturase, partial [Pseudomonadota bacterium]|nr:fatty acid desaturase [Pseudomonadota bacterium]